MILGNFIGTDVSGTNAVGNGDGVFTSGAASNTTIGGTTSGARNLISGNNLYGVDATSSGSTLVAGNFIGTDVTGSLPVGNGAAGVKLESPGNTVGGVTSAAGNVISANSDNGVVIADGTTPATGNLVAGNFIGTDVTGTKALGVGAFGYGVEIDGASNNTIGGTTPGARNLIPGGVTILDVFSAASGNLVQGNFIGTDVTGTQALGIEFLFDGVSIGGSNNTVGGTTAGARNLISGNDGDGVALFGPQPGEPASVGNVVEGNFIGTDVTGSLPLGNQGFGVNLDGATNDTVGGTASGAGNLISANVQGGIALKNGGGNPSTPATGNLIAGNFVGTDVSGTVSLGNTGDGVMIGMSMSDQGGESNNTIGGTTSGAANIIAFNTGAGVRVGTAVTDTQAGNVISGNSIFFERSPRHRPRPRRRYTRQPRRAARRPQPAPELPRDHRGGCVGRQHDDRRDLQQHAEHHLHSPVLRQRLGRPVRLRPGPDLPRPDDRDDRQLGRYKL